MLLWLAIGPIVIYVLVAVVHDLVAYMRCKYYESQGFVMKFVPVLGFASLYTTDTSMDGRSDSLSSLRRALDTCRQAPGLVMNDWQQMKAYIWLTDPNLVAEFFLKETSCMRRLNRYKGRLPLPSFYSNDSRSLELRAAMASLIGDLPFEEVISLASATCRHKLSKMISDQGLNSSAMKIDFKSFTFEITLELIRKLVFGGDQPAPFIDEAGVDVINAIHRLVSTLQSEDGNFSSLNFFLFGLPSKFDLYSVFRKANKTSRLIEQVIINRFRERLEVPSSALGNNLLDCIIKKVTDGDKQMTESDSAALIIEFVLAGIDSVSKAAMNTIFNLAKEPELAALVRQETKDIGLLDGKVGIDGLRKASLLDRVYKETLRLHSPIPVLTDRMATCDFSLGKITIKKGEIICIPNFYFASWSKSAKRSQDKFEMKNITEPSEDNSESSIFDPYSKGNRRCPGDQLAEAIVKTLAIEVLDRLSMAIEDSSNHHHWILDGGYGPGHCSIKCSSLKSV